jgi:hypothetical protein
MLKATQLSRSNRLETSPRREAIVFSKRIARSVPRIGALACSAARICRGCARSNGARYATNGVAGCWYAESNPVTTSSMLGVVAVFSSRIMRICSLRDIKFDIISQY